MLALLRGSCDVHVRHAHVVMRERFVVANAIATRSRSLIEVHHQDVARRHVDDVTFDLHRGTPIDFA